MEPEDLRSVIECAGLAPSVHNTQPWIFNVSGDTIEIHADRRRGLSVLDPRGRELTISCGAAIEFARIATRGLGWECDVQLLPDASNPDLLATVTIGAQRGADDHERELLDAIPRRYTDRGTYTPIDLAPELAAELEAGASSRGAWLRVLDHAGDRLAVIQALGRAETAEAADPAFAAELASWLRSAHSPDGMPPDAFGDVTPSGAVSDVPLRDFSGENEHPRPGGDGPPPDVERDALLMIGTTDDSALCWLQAGCALGWILLTLTVAGLSAQPLGQAIDIESVRRELAQQIGLIGAVQFLLRAGDGHGRPTTGRRELSSTR